MLIGDLNGGGNSRFWFDELKKGLEPFYHYLEKVKNINQKYFKTEFIFLPTHGDFKIY